MKYFKNLKNAMELIGSKKKSIFLGQAVSYPGTAMFNTLKDINKKKLIELPVAEEMQMGMTIGMMMSGYTPVSIYPRFNFLLLAINQLVNHLDKLEVMSDGEWKPNVIVRVGKGSDKPLDPGHQHKADYTDAFKQIVTNCKIEKLRKPEDIVPAYKTAMEEGGIHILVEYPELYYEQ